MIRTMPNDTILENDLVFLVYDARRRWLVQIKKGMSFHSDKGIIEFDELIGKPFGTVVFSKPHDTQGFKFYALKPLPSDYILHMSRKTQIIYPEDAGFILIHSGISPGSTVIEAGCGSGALTCILGAYVRPNGHIYSFDISDTSLSQANKNVQKAKLSDVVTIQKGDILSDDLPLKNIDSIVLDMPTPWDAIAKVKTYLKSSGSIVSFSPVIEQAKKTTLTLRQADFIEVYTYELLKRTIQVKENATRPETRMVGHTGYITVARKIQDIPNPYREIKPKKEEFVNLDGMPLRE